VGNPLISYDWALPYIQGESQANSLTIDASLSLAYDKKAIIQFDDVSQTPFFVYTQLFNGLSTQHIVWSIDARTISALVELISELGLSGAGLWNVMIYFHQLWLVINSQYEIEKLLPDNLSTI
jgi:spore germination protein